MANEYVAVDVAQATGNARVTVTPAAKNTGRNARTIILKWKSADVQDVVRTIKHVGKPEYVSYENDSAEAEKLGQTVTIFGTSNSSRLTFSLGNGELDNISLPESYMANYVATRNGEPISGDPGASAEYEFSISIEVPANREVYIRSREIFVADEAGNRKTCILSLEAGDPFIYIPDEDIELDAEGSPETIEVDCNTEWTVEHPQWEDGGNLYVDYEGKGAGEAVFTSDVNEGLDREMSVTFSEGVHDVEKLVKQEGKREIFEKGFVLKGGGTFNVLKQATPYTRLAYLESTGKQWIDTGFDFDYNHDTVLRAEAEALSTGRSIVMGSYYDGNYRCVAIEFGGTSNSHAGAARGYIMLKKSGALDMWSSNASINVKRNISLTFTASNRKAVLYFDGEVKTGTSSAGTLSSKNTVRMFLDARTSNASAIQYPLRIYSAQIKQDGVFVRDFIPVLDPSGVACMFDRISKEYFYNKGTGSFIAGY